MRITRVILERLAQGPARPVEIVQLLGGDAERFFAVSRALGNLYRRGKVSRTRLVLGGRHGGNVAMVYQLLK